MQDPIPHIERPPRNVGANPWLVIAHDLKRLGLAIVVVGIGFVGFLIFSGPFCSVPADRVRYARARSDMRSMATAIETYKLDHGSFPAYTFRPAESSDSAIVTPPGWPGTSTFRVSGVDSLTTPVAYLTATFPDPFASAKGATFRYQAGGNGWILGSFGPDRDQSTGGDFVWQKQLEVYDSAAADPIVKLLPLTYDPTNGLVSNGDVWRIHQ